MGGGVKTVLLRLVTWVGVSTLLENVLCNLWTVPN